MTDRRRGGSCTEKDRHSDRQLAERGAYTENDRQTEGRVMHGKDRHSDRQLVERGAYTEIDKQTEGRVMHEERETQ